MIDVAEIDRPLTAEERDVLQWATILRVAHESNSTSTAAAAVLDEHAARGEVRLRAGAFYAGIELHGRLVVVMSREELALIAIEDAQ